MHLSLAGICCQQLPAKQRAVRAMLLVAGAEWGTQLELYLADLQPSSRRLLLPEISIRLPCSINIALLLPSLMMLSMMYCFLRVSRRWQVHVRCQPATSVITQLFHCQHKPHHQVQSAPHHNQAECIAFLHQGLLYDLAEGVLFCACNHTPSMKRIATNTTLEREQQLQHLQAHAGRKHMACALFMCLLTASLPHTALLVLRAGSQQLIYPHKRYLAAS
jgi:hypothetical protein